MAGAGSVTQGSLNRRPSIDPCGTDRNLDLNVFRGMLCGIKMYVDEGPLVDLSVVSERFSSIRQRDVDRRAHVFQAKCWHSWLLQQHLFAQ